MIICPIAVMLPRKTMADKRILLNQNRMHHVDRFTYNLAKIEFDKIVSPQLQNINRKYEHVKLVFYYYNGVKRLCDLSNNCVFIDKFLSDSLVKAWIIPADDYSVIKEVNYVYWGYDKDNARVEVDIIDLDSF